METSTTIKQKLANYCGNEGRVIVLCVGSDRITGDCLGPMVGQLLTRYYNLPSFVYGSLDSPVTALNLRAVMASINRHHKTHKIIAVDSCVGKSCDIGKIRLTYGGLLPGSADGKNLPIVGDVSITAVTSDQPPASNAFSSVRLGFVYSLSKIIAEGISAYFSQYVALPAQQILALG